MSIFVVVGFLAQAFSVFSLLLMLHAGPDMNCGVIFIDSIQ